MSDLRWILIYEGSIHGYYNSRDLALDAADEVAEEMRRESYRKLEWGGDESIIVCQITDEWTVEEVPNEDDATTPYNDLVHTSQEDRP